MFFNWYLSYEKNTFADNLRVEPTIIFMEKISFSLKLFSGHFYGQSFIKTVRGPCSYNNTAKGIRLLNKIVIFVYTEKFHSGKSF